MSNKMALDALTAAKTQLEILLPDYGPVHDETEALAKIDAAIAALQAEPQGWQPIETAPENTQVAALFRGERPVIAHKNVPHDIPSGWCHEFAGGHYFDHPTRGLTHWMPLPDPPVLP